jgi:hypothetical protein
MDAHRNRDLFPDDWEPPPLPDRPHRGAPSVLCSIAAFILSVAIYITLLFNMDVVVRIWWML